MNEQTNIEETVAGVEQSIKEIIAAPYRPTATDLRRQQADNEEEREARKAAEVAEAKARERLHQELMIDALITTAWRERLRQTRGDEHKIGPRDIHIRNLITKTLMTIGEDNHIFAAGESLGH